MNSESINLSLLLISDPNLLIILNDPDVYRTIKDLIIKMQTDSLYTNKLSNSIQKDDFETIAKKTHSKNKKDLLSQLNIMIDTMTTRKKNTKRFKEYQKYLNKVF
jgi:beta-mannanase